jgi:uncharacterized protein
LTEPTPTVIVSRRVRPGAERDFERWNERLRAAAKRFKGYVGSEVQPPSEAHPDEWVTIYRFASVAELDAWLDSGERAALMAEGEHLLDAPAREQRVVEPAAWSSAVTAVLTQRIRPDAEDEFRRVQARISTEMRRFEGFLRSDLLEPVPGVQDEFVIVFSFASKADLDRWLESDERQALLRDVAPLIEGDRTLNVVGGFAGWFPAVDGRRPVRWKQAVAVLLALFPTTLTLGALQRWLLPDVPWVPALFVSNVIGIAILTWLLMPLVTRWLGDWLRRS